MTTDTRRHPRETALRRPGPMVGLLILGLVATSVCLAAEIWLVLELLAVLPEGTAEPAEIERLADIGKLIAGATGATLVVRGLVDRAARANRLGRARVLACALAWVAITAGIYQSLVEVTDAIVDSLPSSARQDAVLIALYRKSVQDGTMIDPDYGPRSTLNDLQRVKAINAAIGLLDRERDYARRLEGILRDGAEARKREIVRHAEREAAALNQQIEAVRQPFSELADGHVSAGAALAWTAYQSAWRSPPQLRAGLLDSPDGELFPAISDPPIRRLSLADVPPGLAQDGFARFVADALASRRDAALWSIEDRTLAALGAINQQARLAHDPAEERLMVLSVVVPPLALSFGVAGIIANATALLLLLGGMAAAILAESRRETVLRRVRPASVFVPWLAVAAAIALAPPLPFTDDQGFARIARQAQASDNAPPWTQLWLRLIGVEAGIFAALPGRG